MKKKKKLLLLVLILIICLNVFSKVPKRFQNDTFFTIAIGERVDKYGIEEDEKLVWHKGLEYTNSRWLFDLLVFKIYEHYSFLGIYIFVSICSVLLILLYFYITNKITKNIYLSFLITVFMIHLIAGCFTARSLLQSFFLFLLEFYCIEEYISGRKKRYFVLLIIIPIVLVNIHASVFPMYFVIIMPYIVEYLCSIIIGKYNNEAKIIIEKNDNVIPLLIIIIVGLLAGFCTPPGMAPFTDLFKAMSGESIEIISELQSINIIEYHEFLFLLIIPISIIAFTNTKVKITDCLFILGFALLSINTRRCVYFFFLISSICIVRIIKNFINQYSLNLNRISHKLKVLLYIFVLVVIVQNSILNILDTLKDDYVSIKSYPIDATKYILENVDISNMRIYNHFNFGSYLEYKKIPAFIDSRSGIYTPEFNPGVTILSDWKSIIKGTVNYRLIFNKYEITHALLYNTEVINQYIVNDPEWKQIYMDNSFSLYERVK